MQGLINPSNDVDFDETWAIISESLNEMHTKNASELSFETIYRHAYKIVLKKKGDIFYEKLQAFEQNWLTLTVRVHLLKFLAYPFLGSLERSTNSTFVNERREKGEKFMRTLKQAFEDHQLVMNMATDVFMYLDRVYCTDTKRPSIYTSGMLQFRDCILRDNKDNPDLSMLAVLRSVILEQIAMDRAGDPIDKPLIKSCVSMLESLYESPNEAEEERIYLTSFEQAFLKESEDFYKEESRRMLREADAATYCKKTAMRIREENDRCRSTLSTSTTSKITCVLETTLIKDKLRELIVMESGVTHMLDHDKFQDLKLVYELNSRVDSKKSELTNAIQRRVQEVGNQINDEAVNAASGQSQSGQPEQKRPPNLSTVAALQWVDAILRLKDKYDQLWEIALESDKVIQPSLTRSFSESINLFNRSSEYLSLFIDDNMKKGLKDKTEAEVDEVLEKAIVLLRYIQDRDMFERYYKKHLCKRLLMGKSLSVENEREMIRKMKIELGNSFVAKMEAMFRDMQLSDELTTAYRKRAANTGDKKRVDLSINVLTSMTWPLESMQGDDNEAKRDCVYPAHIDRVKRGFENFYSEKHQGRRLTWLSNMGSADLRVLFPAIAGKEGPLGKDRRHEINVSTHAMLILDLFNDLPSGASLSFDEIQSRTNINSTELIRNLQPLALAPKTRILTKEPMSKEVKNTDRFAFNERFTSNFYKIKVGVIAGGGNKVESEKERKETERRAMDTRGFQIEAAIVRIMKQRKSLTHQRLTTETIDQLKSQFAPEPAMIKRRIEALIERDYLERDQNDSSTYHYLA